MQKFSPTDFEIDLSDITFREGTGISNLDGRLWNEMGKSVARYFGDEALVRARIGIEARYLIALSNMGIIRKLTKIETETLLLLHKKVDARQYQKLRIIESQTRHDVITMTEIFKKLLTERKSLTDIVEHGWVHWGLTSEDIDNLAHTVLIKNYIKDTYIPELIKLIKTLVEFSEKNSRVVIPGKTHLQTAVPTTLGKEAVIFGLRLAELYEKITKLKFRGKLTGAVGNLSAHKSIYPKVNWLKFSQDFVASLGLEANLYTTQIESKAKLVELFYYIQSINSTLIDLSQDMRIYCGLDFLAQEVLKTEFGSSAMPQKVNPIDFENSQGNSLLSNWILDGLIRQFPVSWLQRDLVDKTIFRNVGLPFGYSQIALISAVKGVLRVVPNQEKISSDLESDWSSLSEAYQLKLRSLGIGDAYNKLKDLAHGKKITKEMINLWIDSLNVNPKAKNELKHISFENYAGYAPTSCLNAVKKIKKILASNILL